MFYDRDDDLGFRIFFRATPIVLALVFLLIISNAPTGLPAPKNQSVFGCYATTNAPAIRLDAAGMHIAQAGFPTIPFHIEFLKTGYALAADRPIQANASRSQFTYSFYNPGEGTYLNFFHIIDGKKYGVIEKTELESFTMLATNGTYLPYTHAMSGHCSPDGSRVS